MKYPPCGTTPFAPDTPHSPGAAVLCRHLWDRIRLGPVAQTAAAGDARRMPDPGQ